MAIKVPAVLKSPEMKAFLAMSTVFVALNVVYHMSPGFRSIFSE